MQCSFQRSQSSFQRSQSSFQRSQSSFRRFLAAAACTVAACTASLLVLAGCGGSTTTTATAGDSAVAPTVEEAAAFLERAERELMDLNIHTAYAEWLSSTYIILDSQAVAARARGELTAANVALAKEAARFNDLELPPDLERKLELLKLSLVLPGPGEPALTRELTETAAALEADFGGSEHCRPDGECLTLDRMIVEMGTSRDPDELLDMWTGWRTISTDMRQPYTRLVELSNQGAAELGYPDLGAMWRSKYDMPPDDFAAELDRLWEQVSPLYEALHCHVRARLGETYGTELVPPDGPLPAHLLGNMWAQSWLNVYDLVSPADADPGYDLTALLEAEGTDAREMVRIGENFFVSLGFDPLPETFWERSLFVRPRDRNVVCHASAWSMDFQDDLRIKMCIKVSAEDFNVIHHELGHNFYQRAYNELDFLYQDSANDGFHEAVGDTVALSLTPKYLVDIGLLDAEPDPSKDIGLLLRQAMDRVAFLPFGLLIDKWRWDVFSGATPPEQYNQDWWELRLRYQGVAPPVERTEEHFDPGAKYHVPASVPYSRYFLAHILQFQFHRALCDAAGYEGPLHRCSIYDNSEAGQRLRDMLAMGLSRPWPDALEAITGQREMDASAVVDYFAPLMGWLEEQNAGRQCGW